MEYTFRYYLSLGFCCTGGEVYREDNFKVDLTDDQVDQIKVLLKNDAEKAPAFEQIEEHLPEIHDVIMEELYSIAYDYVTVDGYENGYYEVSDEEIMEEDIECGDFDPTECEGYESYGDEDDEDDVDDNRFDLWQEWQRKEFQAMNLHDQAEYVRERYKLEPDSTEGVHMEYYLPKELFEGDQKYWR